MLDAIRDAVGVKVGVAGTYMTNLMSCVVRDKRGVTGDKMIVAIL